MSWLAAGVASNAAERRRTELGWDEQLEPRPIIPAPFRDGLGERLAPGLSKATIRLCIMEGYTDDNRRQEDRTDVCMLFGVGWCGRGAPRAMVHRAHGETEGQRQKAADESRRYPLTIHRFHFK